MRKWIKGTLLGGCLLLGVLSLKATQEGAPVEEREDFVTVSLMIASPGTELFSCVGHAFLRLECPTHQLDYCFSYESEPVSNRVFSFLSGKLKMGMLAMATDQFLTQYRVTGRGVWQYRLNLPLAAKKRLWQIMDEKAAEGANLMYDYMQRGCAWSVLSCLQEAIKPQALSVSHWPDKYRLTRRELTVQMLEPHPWLLLFLQTIVGTEIDRAVPRQQKVIMPQDLRDFLHLTTIAGTPVISSAPQEIVAARPVKQSSIGLKPIYIAFFCVLLSLLNIKYRWRMIDYIFLSFQSILGIFISYLIFCSDLPATNWSWLIIPFNPLPLLGWSFRRYWAAFYAALLGVWLVVLICAPHQLTDPAYEVLVGAYILFYIGQVWRNRGKTH